MTLDLIEKLQTELENRKAHAEECRQAHAAAEAEVAEFVAQIATTLGLNAAGKKDGVSSKLRQQQVLDLHLSGTPAEEIANTLKVKRQTVDYDLKMLRKQGKIPRRGEGDLKSGSQEATVLDLYREGCSINEIVEKLGVSRSSVDNCLGRLRSKGLIAASTVAPAEPEEEPDASPLATEAPGDDTNDDGDDDEPGSSKEQLVAETARQQQGKSSQGVQFATTMSRKHRHGVVTDGRGHGTTKPDASGHVHRVYSYVLSRAHNHSHDLVVPAKRTV